MSSHTTRWRAAAERSLSALAQDVRFALRSFRVNPAFTMTAVVTLGLGIAAATSVVSIVDATLLRPLPFPAPHRVVNLDTYDPARPRYGWFISRRQADVLRGNRLLDSVAEYSSYESENYTIARPDGPQVIHAAEVSAEFFTVFRVAPVVGRAFTPEDGDVERAQTCILTRSGLVRLFQGQRDVVGRTLPFVEGQLTVVGVMPDDYWHPMMPWAKASPTEANPDLLVPIARRGPYEGPDTTWPVAARMAPGATVEQVQREVEAVLRRIRHPAPNGASLRARVRRLQDEFASDGRTTLLTLLGFAGCLLLICAVNIANLLLSHSNSRVRELAVRTTLGAGRLRLFRQLLTEHLVLALMGGLLGLYLTMVVIDTFVALLPRGLLIVPRIDIDARVFGLAALVTLATGVLAGLGPAVLATRAGLSGALKAAAQPGMGATPRCRSFASVLLAVEACALLILLSGGGLLVNTLIRLKTIDLRFEPERLWTADFIMSRTLYPDLAEVSAVSRRAVDAIRALPGVVSVGESDFGLLLGHSPRNVMTIVGRPEQVRPQSRHVSADYFRSVNIGLQSGRLWTAREEQTTPEVAVINQAAAREYFAKEDPIGRRVVVNKKWQVQIIGVVRDLREANERQAPGPSIYLPMNPVSSRFYRARTLVIRTAAPQAGLAREAIRTMAAIDPRLVVTMSRADQTLSDRRQAPRFYAVVVGIAGVFGLLLAAVGIGGVTAQGVTRRTREIGVRLALGADRFGVVGMVVRQVCAPVAVGVAIGAMVALALARVMTSFLYEVKPQDPVTHVAAVVLLLGIAVVAAVLPAHRAARISPVDALRAE